MNAFKKVCDNPPVRAELILPGTRPTVPCWPPWLIPGQERILSEQAVSTNELEVSSFLTVQGQSRTKHFTSVMPPSSPSSEAAPGAMIRIWNEIKPGGQWENNGQCQLPDHSKLLPPTNSPDFYSRTLENDVSYSKGTLSSKVNIQLRLWEAAALHRGSRSLHSRLCVAWGIRAQLKLRCMDYDDPCRCI